MIAISRFSEKDEEAKKTKDKLTNQVQSKKDRFTKQLNEEVCSSEIYMHLVRKLVAFYNAYERLSSD